MDEYESLSHSKWECKYHVVFIPKCRRKVLYGTLRKHLGEVFRKLAEQKEMSYRRGAPSGRPCPHDALYPTEVCRVVRGGIYQRQERNPSGTSVWRAKAELCRPKFLGAWLFRIDGRPRRSNDPRVHPQSGKGRRALGPDESLEITRHHQGGSTQPGPRQRPRSSRFERLTR